MGLFSNRIEEGELKPGDHIYSWRRLYTYAHHGIYMGNKMVIHFKARSTEGEWEVPDNFLISPPDANCMKCRELRGKMTGDPQKAVDGVTISCLKCFLAGGELYRFGYSVSALEVAVSRPMTCTTVACDPPKKVLQRATALLKKGFGQYSVLFNNCQDFAYYCKTENSSPSQRGNKVFAGVLLGAAGVAVTAGVAAIAYNHLRVNSSSKPKFDEEEENNSSSSKSKGG